VKRTTVEERRTEILETTCQVVIERGFAATRVADVANKLGVSTGLIHYHFESKDQLLAEAFEHAAEADLNRLAAELARTSSSVDKLDVLFRLASPETVEADWMLWIDGWGEALRSPAMRKISQDLDIRFKDLIEDVIAAGVADGSFTCIDPSGTSWRLAALLDGLSLQATVHEGVITRPQILSWVHTAACSELGLPATAFVAHRDAARTAN